MLKCKGSKNKIEALPILVYILNNKKPISYWNQNGIQNAKIWSLKHRKFPKFYPEMKKKINK